MDENRARRVVDALRERGVDAHVAKVSVYQFGIRVMLPGGRQAEWDTDDTAGLEAQVMKDGMLVGFVPTIEGSEDFDEQQTIDALAAHRLRPAHRHPPRPAAAAAAGAAQGRRRVPPLPRGFRER